jgi:hypothetical protein
MKRYIPMLALVLSAACTNGQGEVDVTVSNEATFPGAPAAAAQALAGQTVTTDSFVTVDIQQDLESLGKVGSVTAEVSKNTISGADLSFIQHVTATIEAQDGSMPVQTVADLDIPAGASEVSLSPMKISNEEVLAYLSEGKVNLHFFITGSIPDRPITLTHSLVAHLSVAVQGSVLKF